MWKGLPLVLGASGIRPVVTSDEVPRAKPAPDCYLSAAPLSR